MKKDYTNTLCFSWAKNTQSYLNELYTTEKDSNYRYVLSPLIGKKVRIESLEFEISEDSNTTEDNVEHKYKKILVRNGQITRINPYNDEVLPIVLEHIWFMVGDDFEPDESATKIVINGTVNEYMKTNGSKNVGVDVTTVSMSAGNNIVIPSSYKQTETTEEDKDNREEKIEYDIPKVFKDLPTLDENECRVMKAVNFYGIHMRGEILYLTKYDGNAYDCSHYYTTMASMPIPLDIIKYCMGDKVDLIGFRNTYHKVMKIDESIWNFVINNNLDTFSLETIANTDFSCPTCMYTTIENTHQKEKADKHKLDSLYIAKYLNDNKSKLVDKEDIIMNCLAENNFIEIQEVYTGTYEQDLAAYKEAVAKRDKELSQLREQFPSLDVNVKEIPEPINHDKVQYRIVLTDEGRNLVHWYKNFLTE